LGAFLENRPVKVRPPGALLRLKRWATNNRKLAAAVIFAVTSLVVGLGVSLWQRNLATNESVRANREADRAVAEAQRASSHLNSMFQAIDLMLADNEVDAQAEVPESQKKLLMQIVSLQQGITDDRDADEFTISQLEGLSRVVRIHKYLGQYEECEAMFQESLPLFEQLDYGEFEQEEVDHVWSLTERLFNSYIFSQRRMSKPDSTIEAIDGFEKMVERAEPFLDPLDSMRVRLSLLNQRVNVAIRIGDPENAMVHSKRACSFTEELMERFGEPAITKGLALNIATSFANRARAYSQAGLREKACESTSSAIKLLRLHLDQYPDSLSAQKLFALMKQYAASYSETPGVEEKEILEQNRSSNSSRRTCTARKSWPSAT